MYDEDDTHEFSMNEPPLDDSEIGTAAKKEINELIWRYGHPDMPLKEAERLACEFFCKLESWKPGSCSDRDFVVSYAEADGVLWSRGREKGIPCGFTSIRFSQDGTLKRIRSALMDALAQVKGEIPLRAPRRASRRDGRRSSAAPRGWQEGHRELNVEPSDLPRRK